MATLTAPSAGQGVALAFERVNSLEHADAIKQLFLAHERPEFPEFFDRTYPAAIAAGGASWIGRDEAGRVCAHIAQFPREFEFSGRTLRAALLANLMVATPYRKFWPALRLVRRLVEDVKTSALADFIYADPNEQAQPLLHAVGFRPIGALRRFVLPLADRRSVVGLALLAYHRLGRIRTARLLSVDMGSCEPGDVQRGAPAAEGSLVPARTSATYRSRLAGYPSPSDRWYAFHAPDAPDRPIAHALVRGPDSRRLSLVCAVQCEPIDLLSSVLVALGSRLREQGTHRVEISVMAGSRAAHQLRTAGFLARAEHVPVLALPLTAHGEAVVQGEWRVMPVDLDR